MNFLCDIENDFVNISCDFFLSGFVVIYVLGKFGFHLYLVID